MCYGIFWIIPPVLLETAMESSVISRFSLTALKVYVSPSFNSGDVRTTQEYCTAGDQLRKVFHAESDSVTVLPASWLSSKTRRMEHWEELLLKPCAIPELPEAIRTPPVTSAMPL